MADTTARSPSPMSDEGDEQVSEATEVEELATAEAGPSSEVKASSSGKGKGKGGGQQNRARVTVVCAECKRLKLKCDRQQPCFNCKTKDKVDKCVYSQEAAAKVDSQSLHNRLMAVEVTLWSMSLGLPVVEYESTHPAVVAEIKKRVEKYQADGGEIRPGSNLAQFVNQTSGSGDAHDEDACAKGSLLSDLHDLPHGYTHLVLESEGVPFHELCTCDHDPCTSVTEDSAKVKEEDGREALDVNMNQDVVREPRQPKSTPKVGPALPSVSHYPDNTPHLPPLKVYYPSFQATKDPAPSFYPAASDSRKAYVGTNSPPPTPSTTEPSLPLGSSNAASRSSSGPKPSVTPGLIQSLPPYPRCIEMLTGAQSILAERPIELGLRSRTAALPQELRDLAPTEMSKAAGWVALTKRVKKCLSRGKDQSTRPSARQKAISSTSPIPVPLNVQLPRDVKRAQAMAVYGGTNSKDKARSPSPIKLDPRILSQKEKGRAKLPQLSTSMIPTHSAPPPPADESLPFFAVICAVLAFGADPSKDHEAGCKDSAPYLLALAQQALGLWVDGGEHIPGDRTGDVTDEAVKEARADFFRAYSLTVEYYLNKSNPAVSARCDRFSSHPNQRQLVNLMSKLVTQLASWGYEEGLVPVRDADEAPLTPNGPPAVRLVPRIAVAEGQEARARLLWQVLFYDVCIAGMFQREPLIPPARHAAMDLPTLVPDYRAMVKDVLKSSDNQDEHMGSSSSESAQSVSPGKPLLKERREVEEERMRNDRFFLGLRARITRLSSVVDRRLARGYSLEQAAGLAGEVQALFDGLPAELCWAMQHAVKGTSSELLANGESLESVTERPSPPTLATSGKGKGKSRAADGNPKPKSARLSLDHDGEGEVQLVGSSQELASSQLRIRTLSCELTLMAQLLVVRIYSPFAPKRATASSGSAPSSVPDSLLNASKAIVRVAKLMQYPAQSPFAPSTLLAMYSLDQLVLDATLLCAQHCFGGTIIKSKDSKSGVQKKDSGSGELLQTIGIGLDLLDLGSSRSTNAEPGPSSSFSTHDVDISSPASPLVAKVVGSLRKQWSLKNSSLSPAQSRKRTRSTMEGRNASTQVEQAKKTPSPSEEQRSEGVTEEQIVPSETPADDHSKDTSLRPADPPSSQPPRSPQPAVSLDPAPRVTVGEVVGRKKGKGAHAAPTSKVGVRSRAPGGASATKRKQEAKSQTPSQPLMTTAARTVKEDGRLGYVDEDQAPSIPPRPPVPVQPAIVQQITPPQPHAQPPPPSQLYGRYDAAPNQVPYNAAPNKPSPASRYQPTFDGGLTADDPVPATPYQEFSGYPTSYPPQPAAQQNTSYHQQHRLTYSPHPHGPIPPVPTGMAPDGYFNHHHGGNSGYANQSTFGAPPGPDVYMKRAVAASSYSTLSYPTDLPPASGNSMSTWQDPQTTPMQMHQPLPQQSYSAWPVPVEETWR